MKTLGELVCEDTAQYRGLERYSACVLYTSFGGGGMSGSGSVSIFSPGGCGMSGPLSQPLKIKECNWGQLNIDRNSGDCLHLGPDGSAHLDLGRGHNIKLKIEKEDKDRYGNDISIFIKGLGGYF